MVDWMLMSVECSQRFQVLGMLMNGGKEIKESAGDLCSVTSLHVSYDTPPPTQIMSPVRVILEIENSQLSVCPAAVQACLDS